MKPESDVERTREAIVSIAREMISNDIDLVTGARKLCSLRHRIGESENPVFNPIIGFESETDDYPIGEVRKQYGATYLQRVDEEIAEYIRSVRPAVIAACEKIVRVFSH